MRYSTSSWHPQVIPDAVADTSYVSYTLLRAVSTGTYHSWKTPLRQDFERQKISTTHLAATCANVWFTAHAGDKGDNWVDETRAAGEPGPPAPREAAYRPGYERVAEQILRLIAELRLQAGDRMPTEN